ncbi:MAG: hypothetical protein LBT33_04830 [Spirochaetia bacterium]|jgi:hypothetical protein|nr:hypothetical protein [Spirochaetia bacterium]
MTHIKSAMEIALERTQDIKGDKAALVAAEEKEEGKKLASAFFQDPGMDLAGKLKNLPKEKTAAVKEGFFQVMLSNLTLPRDEEDLKKLDPLARALEIFTGGKARTSGFKSQLEKFFKQWLDDKKNLGEALRQQLGPLLKQKEAQIAQQLGRQVRLDPRSDPDYMKAYNKNMGNLESRYGEALAQAKEDIAAMLAG